MSTLPNYQVKPFIFNYELSYRIIDNRTGEYIKNIDDDMAIWNAESKINADLICQRLNEQDAQ